MKIVEPRNRPRPFKTPSTHARLRHDYAIWHSDHVDQVLSMTGPKLPFSNKSKFDSARIIDDAITKSYEYPALVASNGNHVVVFDMKHQVGFDEVAGRSTSMVTVVLKATGEVITAHPGNAWLKDQREI